MRCEWCPEEGGFDAAYHVIMGSDECGDVIHVQLCSAHEEWMEKMADQLQISVPPQNVDMILVEGIRPSDTAQALLRPVHLEGIKPWFEDPVTGGLPATWKNMCKICGAHHSSQEGVDACSEYHVAQRQNVPPAPFRTLGSFAAAPSLPSRAALPYTCSQCQQRWASMTGVTDCEQSHLKARMNGLYQCKTCGRTEKNSDDCFGHALTHLPAGTGGTIEIFAPDGNTQYTITDSNGRFYYASNTPGYGIVASNQPPSTMP